MTTTKAEGTTAPVTSFCLRLGGAKEIATALTAGGGAYVNGVLQLDHTLGGFGREIAAEAGRHVSVTIEARSLREVTEMQVAWLQHRVETFTAHAKELADLAHIKTMDVIVPFTALLRPDKAACPESRGEEKR